MHDKRGVLIEVGDGIVYPTQRPGSLDVGIVVTTLPGSETCNLTVSTPVVGGCERQWASAKECEVIVKNGRRISHEVIVDEDPGGSRA